MKRFLIAGLLFWSGMAQAHDTWVQTNTNIVRAGDAMHIDLMLGNHGNEHRDFKLASKVDIEHSTLQIEAPNKRHYDLKSSLIDTGYTPQEGFWKTKFVAAQPGLYAITHTFDNIMSYAPERAIKSAKAFFLVSHSLDKVSLKNPGFDRVFGHPLELVPESNPITPMGPGTELTVRLWFKGKPLTGEKVSFIPQGTTLKEGFDSRYEFKTNVNGRVHFTPREAGYYLVVAHHRTDEKGQKYDFTKYGATLSLFVPQICPCCG